MLQTKAGKPARGPTAQEFRDFVRDVEKEIRARGDTSKIIWSWDNPTIHGSVEGGDWSTADTPVRVSAANHTMLPPFSPDMHCVIETSHAIICGALQTYINTHPAPEQDSLQPYMDELTALFKAKLTPAWGVATVRRLFAVTLPAIVTAKGAYPMKSCR